MKKKMYMSPTVKVVEMKRRKALLLDTSEDKQKVNVGRQSYTFQNNGWDDDNE